MSFACTEDEIHALFEPFGTIAQVSYVLAAAKYDVTRRIVMMTNQIGTSDPLLLRGGGNVDPQYR